LRSIARKRFRGKDTPGKEGREGGGGRKGRGKGGGRARSLFLPKRWPHGGGGRGRKKGKGKEGKGVTPEPRFLKETVWGKKKKKKGRGEKGGSPRLPTYVCIRKNEGE